MKEQKNLQHEMTQLTRKSPEAFQHPMRPVTHAMPVNMKKKAKDMMLQRLRCSQIDPSYVYKVMVGLNDTTLFQLLQNVLHKTN